VTVGRPRKDDRIKILLKRAYLQTVQRHNKRWEGESPLSFEDFRALVVLECTWCGHLGSNKWHDTHKGVTYSDTILRINGLDRIDCTKGYVLDNCRVACKFCNCARNTMSVPYFTAWVKQVHDYLHLGGNIN